jgi:hypothetical protein
MPGVTRSSRLPLVLVGIVVVVAGAWVSSGPPRITLLNAALRIDYPWTRALGAGICALGAFLLASLVPRLALKRVAFVLALGPLLVALHLLAWRLEIATPGLSYRGLLGTTAIPWAEVAHIDLLVGAVRVEARNGTQVQIDTTDFSIDQRASVERTLARHVEEHGGPTPRVIVPL